MHAQTRRVVEEFTSKRTAAGPARAVEALPCERDLREVVSRAERDERVADLDAKYPRLDVSFLRWRTDGPMPWEYKGAIALLAVVSAVAVASVVVALVMWDSRVLAGLCGLPVGLLAIPLWYDSAERVRYPVFACFDVKGGGSFRLESSWDRGDDDSPHTAVRAYYDDARRPAYSLTCQMHGALPDAARATVIAARDEVDDVFLVSEMSVSDWEVKRAPVDPLIVGHKEGAFWLLGHFDLTDAEDYVLGTHSGVSGGV